jgi:hypothetical protein
MSLASDLLEKMRKKGQLVKPELLPIEKEEGQSGDLAPSNLPDREGSRPISEEQGCLRDEVETPAKTLEGVRENTKRLSDEELQAELSNERNEFVPVRIYSRLLDDYFWFAWSEAEMKQLITEGIREPVYVAGEILIFRNKSKEHLKAVHQVKKFFPGAVTKA